MKTQTRIRYVISVIAGVGILWSLISYLQFNSDSERDFSTVTGTFEFAEERISNPTRRTRTSGYLEIKLAGDPLRYCVPGESYLSLFQRSAFFSEVKKGEILELTVLTSEIKQPNVAPLSSDPTIFVRGLTSNGKSYLSVEDHIAWQKSNNSAKLWLIIGGLVFVAFMLPSKRNRQGGSKTA
jgi:hypothetical protein